jgi:hypothetical protein
MEVPDRQRQDQDRDAEGSGRDVVSPRRRVLWRHARAI